MVNLKIKKDLEKQGYRIVGDHSAVEVCYWCKKAIKAEDVCYKNTFYGIKSWRCVQMSCSLTNCSNRCLHCWRDLRYTEPKMIKNPDEPKKIVGGCIEAHKKLLQGFLGYKGTDLIRFNEAMHPLHFTLSLVGESFFYPYLSELLEEIHKCKMTSFLVSNGQLPEEIKKLKTLPTQFYISVNAPNKELYKKICNPLFKDSWERFNKTLEILKTLNKKTRTTLRLTMIRNLNMQNPEQYAELIKKASPLFVEVKGYVAVGFSRQRLGVPYMPLHSEVKEFAKEICKYSGYKIIDEKENSRVVLLMKKDRNDRIMKFD